MRNGENQKIMNRGKGSVPAKARNAAETSSSAKTEPIACHPKNSRERRSAQSMSRSEKRVLCYLRDMRCGSTSQSIRVYSEDLRLPREEVKKALQGLARKGMVILRTGHGEEGHSTLSVTVKEER